MSESILCITFDTATGIRKGRLVGSTLIEDGALSADATGRAKMADGFIVSAKIAALAIGGGHIGWGELASGKYAAGSIMTADIGNSQILSAKIAATAIGTGHLLNGLITSAKIGAGQVGGGRIADGGVLSAAIAAAAIGSGHIEAGAIGNALVANYGIASGKIASGAVQTSDLASGISVDIAELVKEPGYTGLKAISSYYCVYVVSGNLIDTALAVSGYMPAIGIAGAAGIASGEIGDVFFGGRQGAPSAVVSGKWGKLVFVGTSGQLTMTPPSLSGQCQQIMGTVKDDDEIFLFPEPGYIEIA